MSYIVKITTESRFMGITGSTHYDFLDSNNQVIRAKFVELSRIDGLPIFDFRKFDLIRSNTNPANLKLKDYNIQKVELIQPMENFNPSYSRQNAVVSLSDTQKLEKLAHVLGYDMDDILDDNKYKAIIRNLKLKLITK